MLTIMALRGTSIHLTESACSVLATFTLTCHMISPHRDSSCLIVSLALTEESITPGERKKLPQKRSNGPILIELAQREGTKDGRTERRETKH